MFRRSGAGIITAAASAMGQCGARLFGAEGARVVVIDRVRRNARATAEEVRKACAETFAVTGDLTGKACRAAAPGRTTAR